LAARQIIAQVEIDDDDWPFVDTAMPSPPPLPDHIQKLITAVRADLTADKKTKGPTEEIITLLEAAGIPHTVVLGKLKTIRMAGVTTYPEGKVEAPVVITDDLYP